MKKESTREGYTAEILREITPIFDKRIDSWYVAPGAVALFRYKDGNAYEVQVRPVPQAEYKDLLDPYTRKKDRSPEQEEEIEASSDSWYKKSKNEDEK